MHFSKQLNKLVVITRGEKGAVAINCGEVVESEDLIVSNENKKYTFNISEYRDVWFKTSTILDRKQTANQLADVRFNNYKKQPLNFIFPEKLS